MSEHIKASSFTHRPCCERPFEPLTNTIIDYRPHSSLMPLEVLHRFSFSLVCSSVSLSLFWPWSILCILANMVGQFRSDQTKRQSFYTLHWFLMVNLIEFRPSWSHTYTQSVFWSSKLADRFDRLSDRHQPRYICQQTLNREILPRKSLVYLLRSFWPTKIIPALSLWPIKLIIFYCHSFSTVQLDLILCLQSVAFALAGGLNQNSESELWTILWKAILSL